MHEFRAGGGGGGVFDPPNFFGVMRSPLETLTPSFVQKLEFFFDTFSESEQKF